LAKLRDPNSGEVIDHALVHWFPAPASYTGENCAEFSIHGSKAVVEKLFRVLGQSSNTRIALPGEFTRRALENGKLDLIQVESIGDLIAAETEQQRRLGISGLSGKFQAQIDEWREQLLTALISVESSLDFSDEVDTQPYESKFVREICDSLCGSILTWLAYQNRGNLLRNGFTILISGPPNAGKSTLLNELAKRDIAIVSELPGTTRDLLEIRLDLNGYLVNIIDSAGVRESADVIETIGIKRAIERAQTANLILWLCDHRTIVSPPGEFGGTDLWRIYTKCDQDDKTINAGETVPHDINEGGACSLRISVMSGYNVEALLSRMAGFVGDNLSDESDHVAINERQRAALENAVRSLGDVVGGIPFPEIVATKLREAMFELEILIGKIGVEDVLGEIFSRFCIGK
jgi:tRNA modification GTPase